MDLITYLFFMLKKNTSKNIDSNGVYLNNLLLIISIIIILSKK